MKEHILQIAKCNEALATAEAKLSRITTDRPKFQAAHTAAVQTATDLREKAARAFALAAVGEGDESAAGALVKDADAATKRAENIALTLAGFDEAERAYTAACAEARQQRADALRAALDVHAEAVAAEYLKNAQAFIATLRRVHAIEWLRSAGGDKRPMFRSQFDSRELQIPALYGPAFDGARTGQHGELLYSALGELSNPDTSLQGKANDAEIALLAKAGLEI